MLKSLLQFILMTPWLLALCRHDWRERRLPNVLTLWGAAVAAVWRLCWDGPMGVWHGCLAALGCSAFILGPYLADGAGMGDLKMTFACGFMLSYIEILPFMFFSSLAGCLLALFMWYAKSVDDRRLVHWIRCLLDWNYDRKRGAESLPSKDCEPCRVPFGIALAVGSWCCMACKAIGWEHVLTFAGVCP